MSVRENAVQVEVGFEVHIDVKPEVYAPTENFEGLPLDQRKCLKEGEEDQSGTISNRLFR